MAAKGVVSYQRVSTKGQEFPRHKQARDQWLAKHPEYELLTTKRDLMSGRKENRFAWLIDDPKKFPADTVLLVKDIDRFSRMEVEQGIRQLFAMFDRGLGIAVCPYFDMRGPSCFPWFVVARAGMRRVGQMWGGLRLG